MKMIIKDVIVEQDHPDATISGQPGATAAQSSLQQQQRGASCERLTKNGVNGFLEDYYQDYNALANTKSSRGSNSNSNSSSGWSTFFYRNHAEDYQLLRPSGNTVKIPEILQQLESGEFRVQKMEYLGIDTIQILARGMVATLTYTLDQYYQLKGVEGEERVVLTCVIEQMNGEPKIVHQQRATGRDIPRQSRWEGTTTKAKPTTAAAAAAAAAAAPNTTTNSMPPPPPPPASKIKTTTSANQTSPKSQTKPPVVPTRSSKVDRPRLEKKFTSSRWSSGM